MSGVAIRFYVYIDGFNLYYGALKRTPYRWLNIVQLAHQLQLPAGYSIDRVKYFIARVSGAVDPTMPARQQAYLNALATLPEVEIYFGSFLSKSNWRPLLNLPLAGATIQTPGGPVTVPAGAFSVSGGSLNGTSRLTIGTYLMKGATRSKKRKPPTAPPDALVAEVHTMEEKGSDVNLAAHLLNDAWKGQFDAAVVISNDTDLVTPIQMVSVEQRKPVTIVCPGRWPMAQALARVASFKRHIHPSMLAASQFPDPIPGTTISKPSKW